MSLIEKSNHLNQNVWEGEGIDVIRLVKSIDIEKPRVIIGFELNTMGTETMQSD